MRLSELPGDLASRLEQMVRDGANDLVYEAREGVRGMPADRAEAALRRAGEQFWKGTQADLAREVQQVYGVAPDDELMSDLRDCTVQCFEDAANWSDAD